MSTRGPILVNPNNGDRVQTWTGFSWLTLVFGPFWFFKQLWLPGILALIVAVLTSGLAWLVFAFFSNSVHRRSLLDSGYVDEARASAAAAASMASAVVSEPQVSSVADELAKLAQLRDSGVLTPEEFAASKAKLLGA